MLTRRATILTMPATTEHIIATGRPPAVTTEIANIIAERVEEGRTLSSVARDKDIPSATTIWRQLRIDEAFAQLIARARHQSAHALAAQTVDIADDCDDPAMVQIVRNRIDSRRWLAGRYNAETYGDRVDHKHAVTVTHEQLILQVIEARAGRLIEHEAGDGSHAREGKNRAIATED